MKRTRRVSIEIEHRRLTFSLTRTAGQDAQSPAAPENNNTELEVSSLPPVCPDCGAPWLTVTASTTDADVSSANAMYRALQQHGLHLHAAPAGQIRICAKSFEEIRFEEMKESL
jgi:hypothetical protein